MTKRKTAASPSSTRKTAALPPVAPKAAASSAAIRKTAASPPATRKSAASSPATRKTAAPSSSRREPPHPRSVPVPEVEADIDSTPDQPFEEGSRDAIGADLRHRMVSEAAYYRYAERGYCDGYEVDDWLAAEAEVDHLLLNPEPEGGPAVAH
jgi:hypothetical protein